MNYEKDGDLRCGSSAVKTVKGFTLIELIIVIAILGILASISSLAVMGFIRDSNIEAVNSKAQQAHASMQNLMLDMEISNNINPVDITYLVTGTAAKDAKIPVYASMEFFIDNGNIDESTIKVKNYDSTGTVIKATPKGGGGEVEEVIYSKYTDTYNKTVTKYLRKTFEDSIAAGFTGYVYADLNVENFVVESIVYSESPDYVKNGVAATGFVDTYKSKSSQIVHGTKNLTIQKDENRKTGKYVGYYPYMSDVGYTLEKDRSPSMPSSKSDEDKKDE